VPVLSGLVSSAKKFGRRKTFDIPAKG